MSLLARNIKKRVSYRIIKSIAIRQHSNHISMKTHDGNEVRTKQGKISCPSTELDLGITLKGGQSFRWFAHEDGYRGVFDGCVWTLTQDETHLFYTVQGQLTDLKNYDKILFDYFRLNVSLEDHCKKWAAADAHFQKSLNQTRGVRILDQDVVENVFSFICSSNNSIHRITSMVEKLCLFFGEKICLIGEQEYYSFPTIEALTQQSVEAKLKKEKFGYRAVFIARAAKDLLRHGGRQWLLNLCKENNISYEEAREQLTTLPGIGPKVADCVCLMSLGFLEALPVDTHIFQIARENYLPNLKNQKTITQKIHRDVSTHLRELWGPLAGWAQAVVFCAKINKNDEPVKNNKRKNSADKNPKRTSRSKKR